MEEDKREGLGDGSTPAGSRGRAPVEYGRRRRKPETTVENETEKLLKMHK